MESTADVRRDIEATRERMSATVGELESRIHEKVDTVRRKLDVAGVVAQRPWPALAIAAIAGAAFGASGSDRNAAAATVTAAKRAPRIAGRALSATASGAAHLAGSAVSRLTGRDDDGSADGGGSRGVFARARARVSEIAAAQARELGEHLGRAADELTRSATGSLAGRRSTNAVSTTATTGAPSYADR